VKVLSRIYGITFDICRDINTAYLLVENVIGECKRCVIIVIAVELVILTPQQLQTNTTTTTATNSTN